MKIFRRWWKRYKFIHERRAMQQAALINCSMNSESVGSWHHYNVIGKLNEIGGVWK